MNISNLSPATNQFNKQFEMQVAQNMSDIEQQAIQKQKELDAEQQQNQG